MATSSLVHIRVTDYTNRPIKDALVSAGASSVHTAEKGNALLDIGGGVELKVEARGLERPARFVDRKEASRVVVFGGSVTTDVGWSGLTICCRNCASGFTSPVQRRNAHEQDH